MGSSKALFVGIVGDGVVLSVDCFIYQGLLFLSLCGAITARDFVEVGGG